MLKKRKILVVAVISLLLCLTGCGKNASVNETADTSSTADTTSSEPTNGVYKLTELIMQSEPANRYEELVEAEKICRSTLITAMAAAEDAGLSENEILSEYFASWNEKYNDLDNFLAQYEAASDEELNALNSDNDFMYNADSYLLELRLAYNMSRAIAQDPEKWLMEYQTTLDSSLEFIDNDGSWPQGYFFTSRVPSFENIDGFAAGPSGSEYGIEDGQECALFAYSFGEDQAYAYVDQLIAAGFKEECMSNYGNGFMWFGRLNDGEGHISAAIMYDSTAPASNIPPFILELYNFDLIGIMIDTGSLIY